MCGIVGIVSRQEISSAIVGNMLERIKHRGPDSAGLQIFQAENADPVQVAFGHVRLAIVDISDAGRQPMSYLDRYWITYNGEIYNYPELRQELERKGYAFRSNTDTEVVLAAYAAWGHRCLERFNGMFSFAILDTKSATIFLARDRFGIKPLYVFRGDGIVAFASEIKALLAHPQVRERARPDLQECRNYLKWGPTEWRERTMIESVTRFLPAHYIQSTLSDFVSVKAQPTRFWTTPEFAGGSALANEDTQEHLENYRQTLQSAVKLRLRADVPVGTCFSGGLDSSSVVALVNQHLAEAGEQDLQHTFSSVYKTHGYLNCDESSYIDMAAARLKIRSTQIEARWQDVPDEHERMIWAMDLPPESTAMSGWHTFRAVAEAGVKVTLDGQGADEQLAGYAPYVTQYLAELPILDSFRKAYAITNTMPQYAGYCRLGVCCSIINSVRLSGWAKTLLRSCGKKWNPAETLASRLRYDFSHNLVNLLHYSDKVSMAWSVESRVPFMDYRLVTLLAGVPTSLKIRDGWTKWIARSAFEGQLPFEIVWRKDKLGWSVPEKQWFTGPLREWLIQRIESSEFLHSLGSGKNVRKRLKRANAVTKLVRELNLAVWFDLFFGEHGMPGRKLGRDQCADRASLHYATSIDRSRVVNL